MVASEKDIQSKLARIIPLSQIEVLTPVGRIDILTPSEIIEVKKWPQWKQALGQIICYGHYYPHHQKRLHFFGHASKETKFKVQIESDKHDVRVTWE